MVVGELEADFDKVEGMHDESGDCACTETSDCMVLI